MAKPSTAADFDAYICGVNGVCSNSVYRETPEEVCQQFGEASIVADYLGTVSGTPPEYYDGGCDLIDLQFGDTFTLKVFTYYPVHCPDGQVPTYNTPLFPSTYCVVPPIVKKNQGPCKGESCCLGNPIHSGVGNKYQIETDFNITSLNFSRAYNSFDFQLNGAPVYAVMGQHWNHSYERHVIADAVDPNKVYVTRSDGKAYEFAPSGNLWVPDNDIHDQLVQLTDAQSVPTGWRYTTQDNTVEDYDLTGTLVSITDVLGNARTLTYDGSNRLDRVDSNSGESLHFEYDTSNRLSTITDHAGREWGYRYDANNNLEFVDNPDGTTKQYHYEDANFIHALTGITDERGIRYATFGYDAQWRANLSTHAGNAQRVDIVYNPDGTRLVTNSLGQPSTYSTAVQLGVALVTDVAGPGCSTCGNADTGYQYDPANNNLLRRTEDGITTRFGIYDAKGQSGCKTEGITAADTSTGACAFDPVASPDARRIDYTYDSRFYNKITSITEPSVYPGQSRVTAYTYDDYGNRLTETINGFDPTGNPVSRTTTREYNGPLHQLSFMDGPRTDVNDYTWYRYHPNDTSVLVGTRGRLKEIEDATGVLVRSNIQYTATGKVQSESRPNGLTLTYTYYPGNDHLQTLTEATATDTRVTRWTYLPTGEVESITTADGTPDATVLTFGYDDARRLTRITDGLGNYIEYTLDTEGNRTFEKTFDANDVLKKQLNQTFDIYNRLDTTAQANESADYTFAPDGTLDVLTDGNGAITDYSYDALRRLTQVIQDQGGSEPTTTNATTGYGYDVADRLTAVTDPVNGTTTYAYDDLGNLITQTSPDTGTTGYQYDAAGNLVQKTDALGQLFTYTYDALNRLTGVDAPGSTDDIAYTYDSCADGVGQLCTVTYGSGTLPSGNRLHHRYTGFGEVQATQGLRYDYDGAGRLSTLDYPSGSRLAYHYDAAGQVSQVDLTVNGITQTLAGNLGYAPFGPLTGVTYGNGLTLSQSLDSAYRMTAQMIPGVLERTYPGYDPNGNRLSQTDTLATPSGFTYDALNRLDTATGPFGTRDYDYDKNGNRTQLIADSVPTALTYEPASNRLDTLGATDVLLDATGNTRNQGNWSYTYTPHHRLSTATEAATLKASFAYNGLGQRVTKVDEAASAGTTGRHFLYGRDGELLVETDQDGNILLEYLYLNGQLLAVYSPDDDQDGTPNSQEAEAGTLPASPDADGDGLSNLAEWFQHGTDSTNPDSDGDGVLDGVEIADGTDPNNAASVSGNGDVNGDGDTNLGDLVLLYQMVAGTRAPTAEEQTRGDMNRDGQLNAPDILLLQKVLIQGWLETGVLANSVDWLRHLISAAQAVPVNHGVLYHVHNDPLGTPQALTDETGATVWTATYDPFGKAIINPDPDNNETGITFNSRFPGQYYDQETGLHYNGARYYDPITGRFLSSDAAGLGAGLDTYAYALLNPINFFDPDGLSPRGRNGRNGGPTPGQPLPGYNWCGPGNNGFPPTNALDKECKEHDKCYDTCKLTSSDICVLDRGQDDGPSCQDICDDDLCQDARRLAHFPEKGFFIHLFCDQTNQRGRNRPK
jgi:RHS repeat-associated protein